VGFLTVSTTEDDLPETEDYLFQSRRGFSDCLDPAESVTFGVELEVSIPSWVF